MLFFIEILAILILIYLLRWQGIPVQMIILHLRYLDFALRALLNMSIFSANLHQSCLHCYFFLLNLFQAAEGGEINLLTTKLL